MKKYSGLAFGLGAYILWGIIPLYWKLLPDVPPLNLLFYRIFWSLIFMLLYLAATKKFSQFKVETRTLLEKKRQRVTIVLAALFISLNWGLFIYTVSIGEVQQASLGYYINPLFNVLAGALYLKEPLSRSAKLASLCALTGVVLLTVQTGIFPLNSLLLALSFCLYGLMKKSLPISAVSSITLETLIMTPLALIYFFAITQDFMGYDLKTNLLLMGAGAITAVPLLLFANAVKRLSYITLGFIQYINPTIMLLLAVFLFREPYALPQLLAFSFIWLGIIVFVLGNFLPSQLTKRKKTDQ